MKQMRTIKRRFYASALCFVIFSCTFLLMDPFTELVGTARDVSVFLLGAVFWLTLILGIVLAAAAARETREYASRTGTAERGRLGALRFFSNRAAAAADALLVLGIAGAVYLAARPPQNQFLYFVELFVLALSLSMHCLLNGNTFAVIHGFKSIYNGGKH